MSEKNCPKVDGEFYHLCYENKDHKAMSLEDCLTGVSERLRGKSWAKDQRTDLVVIGTDETGVDCVLNSPTIEALDTFSEDYDGGMLVLKRISNDRVKTVTVRNMVLRGKESIIFEGKVMFGTFPIIECNSLERIIVPTELLSYYKENLSYYKEIISDNEDSKPVQMEEKIEAPILAKVEKRESIDTNMIQTVFDKKALLKTDDIHPPKSVISVHFFCLTCLMALQI